MLTFLEDFPDFLTSIIKGNPQPTILGDFNILWNLTDHTDSQSITEMLNTFNLHQLMNSPIHKTDNNLRLDNIQCRTTLCPKPNQIRFPFRSLHHRMEYDKRFFTNCKN